LSQSRDGFRAGSATSTDSSDFWVKTDASGARFANYDTAAMVVGSGADAVSLGAGDGAVIDGTGAAQVTKVLDRPALRAPADKAAVYGRTVALAWDPMAAAAGYWLEVASDAGFNEMRVSEWGIPATGFDVAGLDPGTYHWRVAALDAFGLPGAWGLAQSFDLISDTTPPYLALATPAEGTLTDAAALTVTGATEPGVTLRVAGQPVTVDDAGGFRADLVLATGANVIPLVATYAAGNVTERALSVTYRPAAAQAITPAPGLPRDADGRFLTATDTLAFAATTTAAPGAAVRLVAPDGAVAVQGVVGDGGAISLTIPASEAAQPWRIDVLSPLGAVEAALDLTVLADRTAPAISFAAPPPPGPCHRR
jgi:hypothetical protein